MNFTNIIALVTVVISWRAFAPDGKWRDVLVYRPWRVAEYREYWRLLSHGFVHADWTHLLVNMFVLIQFAPHVEAEWGGANFLAIYLGGMLFATLPAWVKHKGNPAYGSLGASGAVAAILLTFIYLEPLAQLYLFFVIPLPAWAAGVLFFLYESRMQRSGQTRIAHDAHLFGAIWGLGYALLSRPELLRGWCAMFNLC